MFTGKPFKGFPIQSMKKKSVSWDPWSKGIMVGLLYKMYWKEIRSILDKEGRFVILQGFLLGVEIVNIGIYAPNSNLGQF